MKLKLYNSLSDETWNNINELISLFKKGEVSTIYGDRKIAMKEENIPDFVDTVTFERFGGGPRINRFFCKCGYVSSKIPSDKKCPICGNYHNFNISKNYYRGSEFNYYENYYTNLNTSNDLELGYENFKLVLDSETVKVSRIPKTTMITLKENSVDSISVSSYISTYEWDLKDALALYPYNKEQIENLKRLTAIRRISLVDLIDLIELKHINRDMFDAFIKYPNLIYSFLNNVSDIKTLKSKKIDDLFEKYNAITDDERELTEYYLRFPSYYAPNFNIKNEEGISSFVYNAVIKILLHNKPDNANPNDFFYSLKEISDFLKEKIENQIIFVKYLNTNYSLYGNATIRIFKTRINKLKSLGEEPIMGNLDERNFNILVKSDGLKKEGFDETRLSYFFEELNSNPLKALDILLTKEPLSEEEEIKYNNLLD